MYVYFFVLMLLNVPVNSYGHVGSVDSVFVVFYLT